MPGKNCWEVKNCGREPGGKNAEELGVCSAATESKTDKINSGRNGGRACWAISGTLCKGEIQGSYAQKLADCMKCDFYKSVRAEEGDDYLDSRSILDKLRN